ncbi:MAG: glycosyltransferase family 4 protein [Streptosporangiaceae bacterium]
MLPVASLLAGHRSVSGVCVICHGSDAWSTRRRARRSVEKHLMRRGDVRVVAVSSFTAGVLGGSCPATVLPPALSREWFDALVAASAAGPPSTRHDGIDLVTAFRLEDWRDKGLPELLQAVAALGRSDVKLIVCGSGGASPDMTRMVGEHPYCTVRAGLSDRELARQFAAADLFVLATRTRHGRHASGEGFGLVLLEAQVAGTPVVAPAFGGSHDAFLNEITGVAPTDESAATLASTLARVLADPARLALMGRRAAEWARESHAPERYPPLVITRLL